MDPPVGPLPRIKQAEIDTHEGDGRDRQDEGAGPENLQSHIPEEEAAEIAPSLRRRGSRSLGGRHRPAPQGVLPPARRKYRHAPPAARPLRCSIPPSDPAAFAAALCTYDTPGDGRLESGTSRTQAARLRRRPAPGWPAEAVSRNPSACITLSTVANSGCPSAD